jgi:hypothetical protein
MSEVPAATPPAVRHPHARQAGPGGALPGLSSMFRDVHGREVSWKRTMSGIALALYGVGFLAATFLGKSPPDYMMHDLVLLAGGGSVLALLERLPKLGGPAAGAK